MQSSGRGAGGGGVDLGGGVMISWPLTCDPSDSPTSPSSPPLCWVAGLSSWGSIRDLLRAVSHSATLLDSALSICYSMCVRDRETESLCLYSPPRLGSQCPPPPHPSLSPISLSITLIFRLIFLSLCISLWLCLSRSLPPSVPLAASVFGDANSWSRETRWNRAEFLSLADTDAEACGPE